MQCYLATLHINEMINQSFHLFMSYGYTMPNFQLLDTGKEKKKEIWHVVPFGVCSPNLPFPRPALGHHNVVKRLVSLFITLVNGTMQKRNLDFSPSFLLKSHKSKFYLRFFH